MRDQLVPFQTQISGTVWAQTDNTDESFAGLVEEIIARLHAGERVAWNDHYARCPKREAELRQLLPSLTALAEIDARQQPHSENVTQLGGLPLKGQMGDFGLLCEIGRGGARIRYYVVSDRVARKVVTQYGGNLTDDRCRRFSSDANDCPTDARLDRRTTRLGVIRLGAFGIARPQHSVPTCGTSNR